ncbi:NAD dehydrogenase [Infundibulicybe gibba]|nr:NAD dehydrogenase [Infundibulicybe gibba]
MSHIRALRTALNSNGRYKFKPPEFDVDFLVIGGGVVGLSVAQRLAYRFPTLSTFLVERHTRAGEETSSRNSEVVHSGGTVLLVLPPASLKTQLCLRGRDLIYERCKALNIPYKKMGKLVVAKAGQESYIARLHSKSMQLNWPPNSVPQSRLVLPTKLLSGAEARSMEPELSQDIVAALWCPETGIVDSHALLESLEKDIIDSDGGQLVYSTRVVRVDAFQGEGWVVQTITGDSEQGDAIFARTVINAAGLSGPLIVNSILPDQDWIPMYFARGSYASYNGPGISKVSHLIYPCPETGPNAHAFQSLGTHLTFDMQGRVRFGPDIQWLSPPGSSEQDVDFWNNHLVPDDSKLIEMHDAVTSYLPRVVLEKMQPDYVGIRPKLVPPGGGFQDFLLRTDHSGERRGRGRQGNPMISLLGIESPGLTSSLAIAELVVEGLLGAANEQ